MLRAEPNRFDGFKWDTILVVAKKRLDISPGEFWKLTFAEFWPLYNAEFLKTTRPMTSRDVGKLKERLKNGDFGRTGSQPSSGNKWTSL